MALDTETGTPPRLVLVVGVAGSGKSTVGRLLAERLGRPYRDADEFHSEANRRPGVTSAPSWCSRAPSGRRRWTQRPNGDFAEMPTASPDGCVTMPVPGPWRPVVIRTPRPGARPPDGPRYGRIGATAQRGGRTAWIPRWEPRGA
ncbi:shikimate kinase [Streptomyces roseicoloratus]|uniref:Shikimate kinase n=1 Tax=Streptomyces roseicoloratus TaxID=2508722 RepID=A0ABY9RP22_9ACTN|nr:shikimate kinase [Streptomyces roseicoloratus]WMX43947.1 shikimate kinase [Streptomyces roseicoloratus]